jgi:hypothetical protein
MAVGPTGRVERSGAGQDGAQHLNGCAHGNDLVRVHPAAGLLAKQLLHNGAHLVGNRRTVSDGGLMHKEHEPTLPPSESPAQLAAGNGDPVGCVTLHVPLQHMRVLLGGRILSSKGGVRPTLGMRVMPPTRRTSVTSDCEMPASFRQSLHGCRVRFSRLSTSCSNLPRVMVMLKCFAPARIMHDMALSQPEPSGTVPRRDICNQTKIVAYCEFPELLLCHHTLDRLLT